MRIDRAAVLSTLNIKSTGIKLSRGGKKDTETLKASKVDKIRVTFDVGDNDLTIAGLHPIYIRIITPDARELTQERSPANQFSFGGTSAYFAAKKQSIIKINQCLYLFFVQKQRPRTNLSQENILLKFIQIM